MKYAIFLCFLISSLSAEPEVFLTPNDCLFVTYPVPERGIVCSNFDRVMRLAEKLSEKEIHKTSWGPVVITGTYKNHPIFIAAASVGTGSGLLFTELYVAGARYIIRYGSDDVKLPPDSDAYLVKIVDEADNLYGFNQQSGVAPEEWGKSVFASEKIVQALMDEAKTKKINYEMRVCHHLENYHGLRQPEKYNEDRCKRLQEQLAVLKQHPKQASFDMETAVLFRIAKDFDAHAATVLQTVSKEPLNQALTPQQEFQRTCRLEQELFFPYVLDALLRL